MRNEYDFRAGVRGKYASRARKRSKVVVLHADVAAAFPDSRAVNRALRALLQARPPPSEVETAHQMTYRELHIFGAPSGLCAAAVPEISRFLGVIVTMYYDDHEPPHFTFATATTAR